jgi:hypothetical protein
LESRSHLSSNKIIKNELFAMQLMGVLGRSEAQTGGLRMKIPTKKEKKRKNNKKKTGHKTTR